MNLLKLSRDYLSVLRTRKMSKLPLSFLVQNINSDRSDPEGKALGGGGRSAKVTAEHILRFREDLKFSVM